MSTYTVHQLCTCSSLILMNSRGYGLVGHTSEVIRVDDDGEGDEVGAEVEVIVR